jgi:exopolysaccharide biosynthesis polyprenyl glycosylphosphotransferase
MALVESDSHIAVTAEAPAPAATLAVKVRGPRPRTTIWEGRSMVYACLSTDALALLAGVIAVGAGLSSVPSASPYPLLLLAPIAGALLLIRGGYAWGIGSSPLDAAWRAAGAVITAAMTVVVLEAATGTVPHVGAVAVAAAIALTGIVGGRALLSAGRRRARMRGAVVQPALIVGSGAVAHRIARRLLVDPSYGLRPVGLVDAPPRSSDNQPPVMMSSGVAIVGDLCDLRAAAATTGARHVIIAFSGTSRDSELAPLIRDCEQLGLDVSVVPRLFDAINSRSIYQRVGGLPLIGLRPTLRNGAAMRVKRTVDIVCASLGLILGAPLLGALALAVRLDSRGPILYRQRRLGRDGQIFDVLKFRSMRSEPAKAFVPVAGSAPGGVEGDDRRTRVGRLLRRSSLDELPQLINILRGEMSLVGPRPERPEYAIAFARDVNRYDDRLRVRSGLTGWAQVSGLRGQTSIEDRVEWDNYYIEHWSLGLDAKILLRTVAAVFHPGES